MRRASHRDHSAILKLCASALGWSDDDPNEAFFAWKHVGNPVGESPMWIALDGDRVVGVRVFMRWRWRQSDGSIVESVRAVDTATDPEYQGLGIFTDLTLAAVDELTEEGVGFVFNTPNHQSRPGYLKMGWEVVGRVPLSMRILRPSGVTRMTFANVPAKKWSSLARLGLPSEEAFDDAEGLAALLRSQPKTNLLSTERTVEFLRWRYWFEPLGYRVLLRAGLVEDGFSVYRLRERGRAVELTLCDVIVPDGDRRLCREATAELAKIAGGDYLVEVSDRLVGPGPALRVPSAGPILTWRAMTCACRPRLADLSLSLGDVELF